MLDVHRTETDQRSESGSAVLEVFGRRATLRTRLPKVSVGQVARYAQDGEVVLRETDHEFLEALNFPVDGIFPVPGFHAEMPGEMPVGLETVVLLIIVGGGVGVFMPAQMVFIAEKGEEGLDLVVDVGPDQGSPEAAFVLRVVDQKRRFRRSHGGQRRVVLAPEQVGGVLLDVPRVLRAFDP